MVASEANLPASGASQPLWVQPASASTAGALPARSTSAFGFTMKVDVAPSRILPCSPPAKVTRT